MCTGVLVSATVSIELVYLGNSVYLCLNQVNQGLVLFDLDYLVLTLFFCPYCCRRNPRNTVLYFDQPQDK